MKLGIETNSNIFTKSSNFVCLLFCWLSVSLILTACAPNQPRRPQGPIPTPVISNRLLPPTQTPSPTSLPIQQIDQVRTLCLDLKQTGDFSGDVTKAVVDRLVRGGVQVVSAGCDARLSISLDTRASYEFYQVENTPEKVLCYTGAGATVSLKLSVNGKSLAEANDLHHQELSDAFITGCPNIDSAPYKKAYLPAIDEGLVFIWGPKILDWNGLVNVMELMEPSITGPRRAEAVPLLIKYIKREPGYKQFAYQAIGNLGADGTEAIPFLQEMQNSSPYAAQALKDINKALGMPDDPSTIPAIFADPLFPADVCGERLARVGSQAIPIISEKIHQLGTPNFEKLCSYYAIEQLGPLAEPLIPDLLTSLDQKMKENKGLWEYDDIQEMIALIHAIGGVGPGAIAAVPDIIDWWQPGNCTYCREVLMNITGQDIENDKSAWIHWWNKYVKNLP